MLDRTAPKAPTSVRHDHLLRLGGAHGLYEHAVFDLPRTAHGYTTDDNARALIVLAGADPATPSGRLLASCTRYVTAGRVPGGWRNRMSSGGRWLDRRGSDDAHGRALWGLAHVLSDDDGVASVLGAGFDLDSPHPRANAYAALAAAEALRRRPGWAPASAAAYRYAACLPDPRPGRWMWPEPRLTYANARIPQALIAVGEALGSRRMRTRGLELLAWLIAEERGRHGFSFTPVAGRGPGEPKPRFDQQPIEAWAMADACAAASAVDGAALWRAALDDAVHWFMGRNDTGAVLYEGSTGAGFDGLHRDGVNRNRGAESTLAAMATMRLAESVGMATGGAEV